MLIFLLSATATFALLSTALPILRPVLGRIRFLFVPATIVALLLLILVLSYVSATKPRHFLPTASETEMALGLFSGFALYCLSRWSRPRVRANLADHITVQAALLSYTKWRLTILVSAAILMTAFSAIAHRLPSYLDRILRFDTLLASVTFSENRIAERKASLSIQRDLTDFESIEDMLRASRFVHYDCAQLALEAGGLRNFIGNGNNPKLIRCVNALAFREDVVRPIVVGLGIAQCTGYSPPGLRHEVERIADQFFKALFNSSPPNSGGSRNRADALDHYDKILRATSQIEAQFKVIGVSAESPSRTDEDHNKIVTCLDNLSKMESDHLATGLEFVQGGKRHRYEVVEKKCRMEKKKTLELSPPTCADLNKPRQAREEEPEPVWFRSTTIQHVSCGDLADMRGSSKTKSEKSPTLTKCDLEDLVLHTRFVHGFVSGLYMFLGQRDASLRTTELSYRITENRDDINVLLSMANGLYQSDSRLGARNVVGRLRDADRVRVEDFYKKVLASIEKKVDTLRRAEALRFGMRTYDCGNQGNAPTAGQSDLVETRDNEMFCALYKRYERARDDVERQYAMFLAQEGVDWEVASRYASNSFSRVRNGNPPVRFSCLDAFAEVETLDVKAFVDTTFQADSLLKGRGSVSDEVVGRSIDILREAQVKLDAVAVDSCPGNRAKQRLWGDRISNHLRLAYELIGKNPPM